VIVLACILVGLLVRIASGRGIAGLAEARLRGETFLLALLFVQLVLPSLRLDAGVARVGYYVWLATFPGMVAVAWLNRRAPGMVVLAAGLFLNFAVIASNGGMPVFVSAAAVAKPGLNVLAIPAGDFVHVLGSAATRFPWLADVLPLPGPSWLRSVVSAGDCLLFVGVVVFVALHGVARQRPNPRTRIGRIL
jgi:hypothetical protein